MADPVSIEQAKFLNSMYRNNENAIAEALSGLRAQISAPVDMVLHCPACGVQHIDQPDDRTLGWVNPPHRSHLCHGCGHIWRPSDRATNGVASITTKGGADNALVAPTLRAQIAERDARIGRMTEALKFYAAKGKLGIYRVAG